MWTPSRGSATVMVPLIVLFAVLKHHNPAYIPAVLLAALAGKRSFFPPILQPLYRPEAERRLKFNLFILLHLAISFGSFPPYRALRSGMVWYVDEYVQGRRGGQKSWALSGLQATDAVIALIGVWNVVEAVVSIWYPTPPPPSNAGRVNLTSTRMSSPITRAYHTPTETPTKDPNAVRYRSSPSPSPLASTPNRLFNTQRQESPLKQQSTSLVSSQLGSSLGLPTGAGHDDFVMVDRSDREWVDSLRKSVVGKGGTLGR